MSTYETHPWGIKSDVDGDWTCVFVVDDADEEEWFSYSQLCGDDDEWDMDGDSWDMDMDDDEDWDWWNDEDDWDMWSEDED